jgi:hypothetical protein
MIKQRDKSFSVLHMASLAMMIAVTHVSRLAFSFLPNVQPVTVIVLFITCIFGWKDGAIVASLSLILSNLTMGMGIWTVAQISAYLLIVLLTYICQKLIDSLPLAVIWWALYAGIVGYLYGFLLSILQAPILGLNFQGILAYWVAGLVFDSYHAIGNVGFYIILYPLLPPLLEKVKQKIEQRKKETF